MTLTVNINYKEQLAFKCGPSLMNNASSQVKSLGSTLLVCSVPGHERCSLIQIHSNFLFIITESPSEGVARMLMRQTFGGARSAGDSPCSNLVVFDLV